MRHDWISTFLLSLLLGALVYLGVRQVLVLEKLQLQREKDVTDPGPMGIEMRWQVGWDTTVTPPKAVYFERVIDRNPGETVTQQGERYVEQFWLERAAHPPLY